MIAYFDCFSGAAGDMILGSIIDAGLPFGKLKRELKKLPLKGYALKKVVEKKRGIGGVDIKVAISSDIHDHCHRSYKDIVRMISSSRLNFRVKKLSLAIFKTLAEAEAKVHGRRVREVHFHEVGAVDSIVDIVGSAIGFDHFNFSAIYASALPMTKGWVVCQHGRIPLPAPATAEILKRIPVYQSPVRGELVTPTGAAILKTVVDKFGFNPIGEIDKIGYGFGDHQYKDLPNCLRLIVGRGEPIVVIEANIDDMNPQLYEYVIERLMNNGALDVTLRDVLMKKRRLGVCLQCLCRERDRKKVIDTIFKETTTIGVRYYPVSREILERKTVKVSTKYGKINVKISLLNGRILNVSPEYEDCKRLARSKGIALKKIYFEAVRYAS